MRRRDTGILGEKLATDYLKKHRYKILETNYHCPHGETDIIAKKNNTLVFIEVRTKTSRDFGSPEESVTPMKKERMISTAYHYRQTHNDLPELWRIDFIAIELTPEGKTLRIELIENAVGGD
ncbi:YraN family protein [Chloroflexota bacterium]